MSVVVLITFAACTPGQAKATPSPASSPPPRSPSILAAAGATPTPAPQLNVSLSVAYGTVYGRTGEPHCPNWIDQMDNVVLAQSRLTYSDADLTRIASAMEGPHLNLNKLDPALLSVQPGVPTAARSSGQGSLFPSDCEFELEVTNSGRSAVQIARAGLRLTADPERNGSTYRLVEFCSVIHSPTYCGPRGFGAGGCTNFVVNLELASQPNGSDFLATPVADPSCPQIALIPNHSVTFLFAVYSRAALIYRAVPVLDVITPSTVAQVTLPQFASIYTFAEPSAFTCYKLSGSTFTPWLRGAAAFEWDTYSQAGGYCP